MGFSSPGAELIIFVRMSAQMTPENSQPTWLLSNLCGGAQRDGPSPAFELIEDALPVLATLLESTEEDV